MKGKRSGEIKGIFRNEKECRDFFFALMNKYSKEKDFDTKDDEWFKFKIKVKNSDTFDDILEFNYYLRDNYKDEMIVMDIDGSITTYETFEYIFDKIQELQNHII